MSNIVESIKSWTALSENEQREEALAALKSLPTEAQAKLMLYLAKKAPKICETKFFADFANQDEIRNLTY